MSDSALTPARLTEIVAGCHLFTACDAGDQERIARIAQPRTHRRGELIFTQGAPGDAFHLVAEGMIRVLRLTAEGREVHLHVVRPGEIFGLAPFFLDHSFPAQADCATTRAVTLRFPRAPFLRLMAESDTLPLRLLGGLAGKLHEFTQRFEALAAQTVPTRLARWLVLDLAGEAEAGAAHELPMSKRNLAALLGATPESLSRALRRLSDDGLIRLEGRRITFLDPRLLAEVANLE